MPTQVPERSLAGERPRTTSSPGLQQARPLVRALPPAPVQQRPLLAQPLAPVGLPLSGLAWPPAGVIGLGLETKGARFLGLLAGMGASRTHQAFERLNGFEDRGSHRAPSTPEVPFSGNLGIPLPAPPPARPLDRETFEREALVHMDALYRFARRLTGQEGDAEDLLQECYARALRFFYNYREGTNCKAWLFRIMHNLHINRWQARKRAPLSTSLDDAEDYYLYNRLHDPRQSLEGNPEIEFFASNPAPEIRRALGSLPTEFRTPVLLCDVEGLSYHEIARIMDIPVGTVRSRLNRARRRLQGLLADYRSQELPRAVSAAS